MELQKATINDLLALQQLCTDSYIQNFANHWNENGLEIYLEKEFGDERLKADLNNRSIAYYFILSDNQKVGFIKVNYNSSAELSEIDNCELEKIYILPKYKGQGIGKLALNKILKEIQENGKKLMFLCVIDTNTNAIAFYKKLGFKFHGKTRLEIPHFKEELKGMERMYLILD